MKALISLDSLELDHLIISTRNKIEQFSALIEQHKNVPPMWAAAHEGRNLFGALLAKLEDGRLAISHGQEPSVICFKNSDIVGQLIVGPFHGHGAAYDALCEMPAPGQDGHKYIEKLVAFADIPDSIRASARAEEDHAHMMPKEQAQKLTPGTKVRALVEGSGDVDDVELKFSAGEILTIDRLSHLGGSQGLAITAYAENGVVNVFDEADFGGRYPFEAL